MRDTVDEFTGKDHDGRAGDDDGDRVSELGKKIEEKVRDKVEDVLRDAASRAGLRFLGFDRFRRV